VSAFPQPPSPANGPSGPRASFLRRLGAALVDGILVSIIGLPLRSATSTVAGTLISLLIPLLYFGFFEGSRSGQTVGKRVLRIRVIDYRTGGPIGYGRAVLRHFARILSALPCLLGYFWMLWDRERQTWHDKLISDVVVPVESYPVAHWPN